MTYSCRCFDLCWSAPAETTLWIMLCGNGSSTPVCHDFMCIIYHWFLYFTRFLVWPWYSFANWPFYGLIHIACTGGSSELFFGEVMIFRRNKQLIYAFSKKQTILHLVLRLDGMVSLLCIAETLLSSWRNRKITSLPTIITMFFIMEV